MALPYSQPSQMQTPTGGSTNPRNAIAMQLMRNANPPPGGVGPPQTPGIPPQSPFGGIPGGAQPQAALGQAQPPMGPMGAIGGPMVPGMNLPGVGVPGQLPQGMAPQNVMGGGMPQSPNPLQRPPGNPYG